MAILKAIGLSAAIAIAALPFILFAALLGPFVLMALTTVIVGIDWLVTKETLSSDSPWRGFFADIFSGVFLTLLGGLFFGLTFGALLFFIIASILYAILDVFIFAKLNALSGRARYV